MNKYEKDHDNANLKIKITIETTTKDEQMEISNSIHNQLKGNEDYINDNIVLNCNEENVTKLFIFNECKNVPKIII